MEWIINGYRLDPLEEDVDEFGVELSFLITSPDVKFLQDYVSIHYDPLILREYNLEDNILKQHSVYELNQAFMHMEDHITIFRFLNNGIFGKPVPPIRYLLDY